MGKKDGLPFTPIDQIMIETVARQLGSALSAAREGEVRERQIGEGMKTLAHQLVAPLNAMGNSCQELLTGTNVSEERRTKVVTNLSSFCRLACNIANNFDTVQKIADGSPIKINIKRIGLPPLLVRAVALHQPSAWHCGLHIAIERSGLDDLPRIEADEELLPQVFLNLFDNGIKYSLRGTTIRVSLHEQSHSYCVVCVSSVGIPIEEHEREKVFERGYRTDIAKALLKPGMGIGLPVARRIVELHKGRLEVESRPLRDGSGAADVRFFVRLPLPRS